MADVGDDHCDVDANIAECDYDEGDCCPRKDNGCDDCLCYKPFNKTGTIPSRNIVDLSFSTLRTFHKLRNAVLTVF